MAESGADGSRLEMLRERWERDPASRLFLQLAEEYRRDGQPAEAVKVLETGLGHHPGYLAARVALGRCRLETGDAAGAAEALERVIAADPTQLVANKLLIATYLQLGRTSEARDRLDLYVLLNEADPEIDGLERQLMAAEAAAGPAALPDLPTAFGEIEDFARRPAAAETPASALPVSEPLPFAPRPQAAPLDLEALPLPAAARRRVDPATLPPPFPALASPRFRSGASPLAALAAAGIFRWQPAAPAAAAALEVEEPFLQPAPLAEGPVEIELEAEPAVELEAEPAPETEAVAELAPEPEPEPETAPAEAPVAPSEARWWEAREPVPPPAAEPEPAIAPEPSAFEPPSAAVEPGAIAAADETAPRPWWQLPQVEAPSAIAPPAPEALEPEAPELATWEPFPPEPSEPPFGETEAPMAESRTEPLGFVEPPPAPEPEEIGASFPEPPAVVEAGEAEALVEPMVEPMVEPVAEPAPGEATTTLAELYLQQGHLAEAEAAFAAVLARRPGDAMAEAGLARVAERRSLPLGAADLLATDEAPAGLTGRKILLLQRYLQRIREGAKRHVS